MLPRLQAARLNYRLYFVEYDVQYRRAAWNASDMASVMSGFASSLGKYAQKRKMEINLYKNLLDHIRVKIMGERPIWDPRAINDDYSAYAEVMAAKSILDHYMQAHLELYIGQQPGYGPSGSTFV